MNNYLEEIEAKYSRVRGKSSRLSPIDWALAANWEKKEIPLRIVLTAMTETSRNFDSQKRPGKINTLRYFEQAVEAGFAEYNAAQVGKVAPLEVETFICLNCRHYENDNPYDFYRGWCRNDAVWREESDGEKYVNIFNARERCNPEFEDELPESYQYFEPQKS